VDKPANWQVLLTDEVKGEEHVTRLAINGFGRIGRTSQGDHRQGVPLEVVALNDLAAPEELAIC